MFEVIIFSLITNLMFFSYGNLIKFEEHSNNINSINDHRRNTGGRRDRGTVITREVEVFTDITLKVYWDAKQWVQVTPSLVAPDAAIQTIAFMKDLQQILSAKFLIVQKGVPDGMEMRFERVGGHTPMGLKQNRYFACFWKRIS